MQELTKKAVKAPWGRFYGLFSCEEFFLPERLVFFVAIARFTAVRVVMINRLIA
ncbi:hypothetical protein EMIT013CA1_10046 [Bacillus sp. IT-13CA1]|jgi:hypothetical protein